MTRKVSIHVSHHQVRDGGFVSMTGFLKPFLSHILHLHKIIKLKFQVTKYFMFIKDDKKEDK